MRCGVIGSPIGHSLSPAIHRAAYRALDLDWAYDAHEVDEPEFAQFFARVKHDESWRGLSVTMPLKRITLDSADHASDLAHTVGAANTLVRDADGRWFADNTDVPGAISALAERRVARPANVCLWGGGATAASLLASLALIEAGPTHVHVRSVERAQAALAIAGALGHPANPAPWAVESSCGDADLTVVTVPAPAIEPLVADIVSAAARQRALFDVSYHPWPSQLAAAWNSRGGTVVSGLDLLIHQAVGQVREMTGQEVGPDVLRDAAESVLAARSGS